MARVHREGCTKQEVQRSEKGSFSFQQSSCMERHHPKLKKAPPERTEETVPRLHVGLVFPPTRKENLVVHIHGAEYSDGHRFNSETKLE